MYVCVQERERELNQYDKLISMNRSMPKNLSTRALKISFVKAKGFFQALKISSSIYLLLNLTIIFNLNIFQPNSAWLNLSFVI